MTGEGKAGPSLLPIIARTLYEQEAKRSALATKIAQQINPRARDHMEPFEACADVWFDDAKAVLDAISKAESR